MSFMAGPKRGHFSRSRSLEQFNHRYGEKEVEKAIEKAISQYGQKNVRVLEIGCGEGRVLMQLRKLYPKIELHGINKKPWKAMKGTKSLKKTATFYKIFSKKELLSQGVKLPKIYFYDATKLRFKKNYFDVIISQVAIQYFERKDQVIEEAWRVLKTGGVAYLGIDSRRNEAPDFLRNETPRFIIYENDNNKTIRSKQNKIISLKKYAGALRKKGFDILYSSYDEAEENIIKTRACLTMHKNRTGKLDLGIKYHAPSSFELSRMIDKDHKGFWFWGFRSVFYKK